MRKMNQSASMVFLCVLANLFACSVALTRQRSSKSEPKMMTRMHTGQDLELIEIPKKTGAACLDGSSFYASYYPGTSNSWTFEFHSIGVGCYTFNGTSDKSNCELRMGTESGSSTNGSTTATCACHNYDESGTNQSCNCVGLLDCDGSFFAGYLEDPVSSPNGSKIYSRGRRNLNATIDYLITNYGLAGADDILFYGESGSGVGAFLALDAAASKVPDVPIVRGTTVGSYMIEWEDSEYIEECSKMYDFHNIGEQISSDCIALNSDAPHKCMIAPYAVEHIQTPLFMFNSKYDAYQLVNIVGLDREAIYYDMEAITTYKTETLAFGEEWMKQFQIFENLTNSSDSAILSSCICHVHCGPNGSSFFDIDGAVDKYVQWYYGPNHFVYDYGENASANYRCNGGDLDWHNQ